MKDFREQNYYELLDVRFHAHLTEIEAAYQRVRKFLSPGSVATYALFDTEELGLLRKRIDEAFRVLGQPDKRSAYDQDLQETEGLEELERLGSGRSSWLSDLPTVPSTLPGPEIVSMAEPVSVPASLPPGRLVAAETTSPTSPDPLAVEVPTPDQLVSTVAVPVLASPGEYQAEPERPPMPEIGEGTELSGDFLKAVRLAKGMGLERIADITKVNIYYLRMLEAENYSELPAEVYVKGYLRLLATTLGLDPARLISGYLARMNKKKK